MPLDIPRGTFTVAEAGPEWVGHSRLAEEAERAQLNLRMAFCVRMRAEGMNAGDVARLLGYPYKSVRALLRRADERLEEVRAREAGRVVHCFKNVRNPKPRAEPLTHPVLVYQDDLTAERSA